jgi:hypothetical protein
MTGLPWGSLSTIRVRLTAALAAALLPVLILGILQSAIAFHREGVALREDLGFAAQRSAAAARARMESAEILLQTLTPGSVGLQCAQRLDQAAKRLPGYRNLIRFDRDGRVACSAGDVPSDPQRAERPWFKALAAGDSRVVTRDPGSAYSREPSVLAAVRATGPDGAFDGGLAAVISLATLQPTVKDPSLPTEAEVALVDPAGRYISTTHATAFPSLPDNWRAQAQKQGSLVWYGRDGDGEQRVYSAAPVVGDDVFVVLGARSPGLLSWARLNPLTGVLFPLLTFVLALVAVTVVTERVVIRWIAYLQRIAALYARGRLSVRPVQAEQMPPEIRDLAETLRTWPTPSSGATPPCATAWRRRTR